MKKNYDRMLSKMQIKRCVSLMTALLIAVCFVMPVYANDEGESSIPASNEAETSDIRGAADGMQEAKQIQPLEAPASETPAQLPVQIPANEAAGHSDPVKLSANAEIVFYKTTIGSGNFGTATFLFNITRVADRYGNPWIGNDETIIENDGFILVAAGPNQTAVPVTVSVQNLMAHEDVNQYFFKISETVTGDADSSWNHDGREFVVGMVVVIVGEDAVLVPNQGRDWYYNGRSFDAKGGSNPIPPNSFNTFVNEYTGSDMSFGRLRVRKSDFNEAPAFPDEQFEFQLSSAGVPVDMTAQGITIRQVDGRGAYAGKDLKNGRFTLSYDTEVEISGLPVGKYTIDEYAVGFEISYEVSDEGSVAGSSAKATINENMVTTVVFTNDEMDADTSLTLRKVLTGSYTSWGVDSNTFFQARIADGRGQYLVFSGVAPNYTYTGAGATGSEIRISANQPAVISGIPIGTICTVEETVPDSSRFIVRYSESSVVIPGDGSRDAEVIVTNDYNVIGTGNITLSKKLDGGYGSWGVDENTMFTARIKDVTDAGNVYFLDFVRDADGNYEAVEIGTGSPFIQFNAAKPAVLHMLWDDRVYEAEEIDGAHYSAAYTGNNAMMPRDGNLNIMITNTFEHGSGNLIISKRLAGSPGDWGVDESTVFSARVRDTTDGNYVLFDKQPDGRYIAAGNNGSPTPSDNIRELVQFTAGSPAVLSGLWPDRIYEVVETGGAHYRADYEGNSAVLPADGNMNVTITNTFTRGAGNLVVRKSLEGFYGDWGTDEYTLFTVRVKDLTDGNYLLFNLQDDGTYKAFANNGSPNPGRDNSELIQISAARPTILTGLWTGHEYEVQEVEEIHYTTVYEGNGGSLPNNGNMHIAVINTFGHAPDEPADNTPDVPDPSFDRHEGPIIPEIYHTHSDAAVNNVTNSMTNDSLNETAGQQQAHDTNIPAAEDIQSTQTNSTSTVTTNTGEQKNNPKTGDRTAYETMLPVLRESYGSSDIVGFIEIKGTNIAYPVVQSADNEYYLDRNVFGELDLHGSIFLDFENDLAALEDDNTIIYGHNMRDGTKFHNIRYYFDPDFYKKHPYILLTTPYKETKWEIFSFFETTTDFHYLTTNYHDRDDFFNFLMQLQSMSLYETGISITEDDQILVLSTCANQGGKYRYVLFAKRSREPILF